MVKYFQAVQNLCRNHQCSWFVYICKIGSMLSIGFGICAKTVRLSELKIGQINHIYPSDCMVWFTNGILIHISDIRQIYFMAIYGYCFAIDQSSMEVERLLCTWQPIR